MMVLLIKPRPAGLPATVGADEVGIPSLTIGSHPCTRMNRIMNPLTGRATQQITPGVFEIRSGLRRSEASVCLRLRLLSCTGAAFPVSKKTNISCVVVSSCFTIQIQNINPEDKVHQLATDMETVFCLVQGQGFSVPHEILELCSFLIS